jgi:SagB-type dehydrogenase family enzyme
MAASLFLSLQEGAILTPAGEGQLLVRAQGAGVTLKRLTPGLREALYCLGNGAYEEPLTERIAQSDGPTGLGTFYYHLQQLGRRGLLLRSAASAGERLATLVPTSAGFTYSGRGIALDQAYVLSRFAYVHADGGQLLLESPLSHAHILLHDVHAAAVIHALAQPKRIAELVGHVDGLAADDAALVLELLLNACMLGEAGEDGVGDTDRTVALQSWEFHDLLFHSRSREGRHAYPVGGTYRFAGKLDPPPALAPHTPRNFVDLATPDLERLLREDPPFARVQERRHSVREYGSRPITVEQLAEFLYRVARMKERTEVEVETPGGPVRMEFTSRPYPAGGALYEMEFYVVVNACEGLNPGLYHYDPSQHGLGQLTERTEEVMRLLRTATQATGIPTESLQIELILAARFQRVAWKYASMAYAAILKHVGVLYQTMYLVATAMDLAPCAVGCGNADLFARSAGTDYYAESSVGEFLLGSKP